MNKHTPGPWTVNSKPYQGWNFEGGYLGLIVSESTGEYIYKGPSSFHSLKGKTLQQAEANARLIAAAPELLEMVQLFVAEVEFKAMVSGTEGHFGAAATKARALIEKSTGEPYANYQ